MSINKKIMWMLVSFLMLLSLVVASCGQKVVEEEKEVEEEEEAKITIEETWQEEAEEATEKKVELSTELPKYGGVLNLGWPRDINSWDNVYGWEAWADVFKLTNEELWTGDWTKGPAGTGETDWTVEMADAWSLTTGAVAESWDFGRLAEGIITWHIRKGIHFALNPNSEASRLVNGRELTADDVVYSFKLYITKPTSYLAADLYLRQAEITALDKYTVVIKMPIEGTVTGIRRFGGFARIVPHEVLDKWGDNAMVDWRNSVGSGPFIVTDYVTSSSATVVRNPNYWAKDQIGPGLGNQLPYLDSVKFLIITDASTRLAALRTGKTETHYGGMSWDDYQLLKEQVPEMQYSVTRSGAGGGALAMRQDNPELPFHDVRVRQAMVMAINYQEINETLFHGLAIIPSWPIGYCKDYADAYLPLEEAPASVQELFSYNPEKARALLAEAGYPDGFKTQIICGSASTDYLSIIMDMWAKIGIGLEIKVVDGGALIALGRARNFDQMLTPQGPGVGSFFECQNFSGAQTSNASYVNDAHVEEVKLQMMNLMRLGKDKEAMKIYRELTKYVLDQCWMIPSVGLGYRITFWWPWLKNYHGEDMVGYHNMVEWAKYVWIDKDLKKSMGY